MTKLEKEYANMTPAQRKRATAAVSSMMGTMNKPSRKRGGSKKKK